MNITALNCGHARGIMGNNVDMDIICGGVVVWVLAGRQSVAAPLQRAGPLHVGGARVSPRAATARHLVADEEADEHGQDDGDDDGDGQGFHRGRGSRRRPRGLLGTQTHSGTWPRQQKNDVSEEQNNDV